MTKVNPIVAILLDMEKTVKMTAALKVDNTIFRVLFTAAANELWNSLDDEGKRMINDICNDGYISLISDKDISNKIKIMKKEIEEEKSRSKCGY